jgi:predicted RNase H-like nuclease (RuvC/YqgF family)
MFCCGAKSPPVEFEPFREKPVQSVNPAEKSVNPELKLQQSITKLTEQIRKNKNELQTLQEKLKQGGGKKFDMQRMVRRINSLKKQIKMDLGQITMAQKSKRSLSRLQPLCLSAGTVQQMQLA